MRASFTVLTCSLLAGFGGLSVAAAPGEPLTHIADIRGLTRTTAAAHPLVRVRGVVTLLWIGGRLSSFVIEDESGPIWVATRTAVELGISTEKPAFASPPKVGEVVEIEGVADSGGFAPVLLPRTVKVLGTAALPPPVVPPPEAFRDGSWDLRRIVVEGVVQECTPQKSPFLVLRVSTPAGPALAQVPAAGLAGSQLLGAEVRLTGLAATAFNGRREFVSMRVLVGDVGGVEILRPPEADPFAVPRVALKALAAFSPGGDIHHRRLVEGTVIWSAPGGFLYLQDGPSAIRVLSASKEVLRPGDRIEASGFIDRSRTVAGLANAVVRKIGSVAPPAPVQLDPKVLQRAFDPVARQGLEAVPYDFDGMLVESTGRVIETRLEPSGDTRILLEIGGQLVPVTMPAVAGIPRAERIANLRENSIVQVRGVAQIDYRQPERVQHAPLPVGFQVLLRDANDVAVVRAAPWWTPERAWLFLSVALVVLVTALGWVWLLNRRVTVQGRRLAAEMKARREASIEFQATLRERNRLAANLHDTLLQTMGGIGLQLDACGMSARRDGLAELPGLEVARGMVDHAAGELRGSVWALRSLPLRERSFAEALQSIVEHVGVGHPARIKVHTEGPLDGVPDFVAGNLILIAQEALHNALRHGRAAEVEVLATATAPASPIRLEVSDDGTGFTPGTQPGPAQGHFGLEGMRERAERLGGSLAIDSTPGGGTRVVATVNRHPYDEQVA